MRDEKNRALYAKYLQQNPAPDVNIFILIYHRVWFPYMFVVLLA